MVQRPEDPKPDEELIERARRFAAEVRRPEQATRSGPSAVAGAPALAPESIAGYRLQREIHRGGQGVVYQALQKSTNRRVAIKVLAGGGPSGTDERARFDREIRILGALNHPNIVTIHDSGQAGDSPFFVMDYVEGQPLDVYMASAERSVPETLRLFAAICEAVEAAHLRGILHRDLKPGNILIDGDGVPHVLDFGLAKSAPSSVGADGGVEGLETRTMTGSFIGSLPWASPEQTEGTGGVDGLDLRSDVYSLGVVLFQMLTRRFPYDVVGNLGDVLDNIRHAQPQKPSELSSGLDDEVDTIALKCLQKERTRRYQTAGELGRDVQAYLRGEPIQAKRDSAWYVASKLVRRYRVWAIVAALFLVTLLGALANTLHLLNRVSDERDEASDARTAALDAKASTELERQRLERSVYFNRVLLAQYALQEDNGERVKQLLRECPPHLRGWEWRHLSWRSDRSRLALGGHGGDVGTVAVSPDRQWIASGSEDGVIRIWHFASGYERDVLSGHESRVRRLVFTPDAKQLVSCGHDGSVRLWDVRSGEQLRTLKADGPDFRALAMRPDGRAVAAGDGQGTVWLFSLEEADEEKPLVLGSWSAPRQTSERRGVRALCFMSAGSRLAVGTESGGLQLVRASDGSPVLEFAGHASSVTSIDVTPDGTRIASGSIDGTARVWSTVDARELYSVSGHGAWVYSVGFDPYGDLLVTSGADHTVKLWRAGNGTAIKTLRGHEGQVFASAFGPEGRALVSASEDRTVRVWEVEEDEAARVFEGHRGQVWAVALHPAGEQIASASADGTVKVWRTADEDVQPVTLSGHESDVMAVSFTRDGHQLVTGGMDGSVRIWDPTSGQELRVLSGHQNWVYRVEPLPDGERLASCGSDGRLRLWNLRTGDEIASMDAGGMLFSMAVHPDGSRAVTGDREGGISLWDLESGERLAAIEGHSDSVYSMAWRPDGRALASAGFDGAVRLWSADELEPQAALRGHLGGVRCVAYSPDGKRLVSGGWDASLRLWDAESGAEILILSAHEKRVEAVAFSPDGSRIVSADLAGEVRAWETDSAASSAAGNAMEAPETGPGSQR